MKSSLLLLIALLISLYCHAQSVVINALYTGSDNRNDWLELLVVETVDLRGWTIRDARVNQTLWNTSVTFSQSQLWQQVDKGTIIMLHCRGYDPDVLAFRSIDTSQTDGYISLYIDHTDYFSYSNIGSHPNYSGSTMNFSNNNDLVQIRDSSQNNIHAFGYANTPGLAYSMISGTKMNYAGTPGFNHTILACPGTELNDYSQGHGTSYITENSGETSFGLPNEECTPNDSGNREYFIELRTPVWDDPALSASLDSTGLFMALEWSLLDDSAHADSSIGYLISRNTSNLFSNPIDGHEYQVGDSIGNDLIVHIAYDRLDTTYADSMSLECNVQYYYKIFPWKFRQDEIQSNDYHAARGTAYNETESVSTMGSSVISPITSAIFHDF